MATISDPSSDCADMSEGGSQDAPTPSEGHFSLSDADSEIVEREVNQINYEDIPEIEEILFSPSSGIMRRGGVKPNSPTFQAILKDLTSSEGGVEGEPVGMNGEGNPEVTVLTWDTITPELSEDDDIVEVGRLEKCPRQRCHPSSSRSSPVTVDGASLATEKNDNPIKQALASLKDEFTQVLASLMNSNSYQNIAAMVEIANMRTGLGEWNEDLLAKFQAMETDQEKVFHLVDQITQGVMDPEKNAGPLEVCETPKRKCDMDQGSSVEEAGTSRARGRPAKRQAMPMPTPPVGVRKMSKRKCKPSSAEDVGRPKKKGRPAQRPAMPTTTPSPGQLTILSSSDDEGAIDESQQGRYTRWTRCVPSPPAGPSEKKKSKGPCSRRG